MSLPPRLFDEVLFDDFREYRRGNVRIALCDERSENPVLIVEPDMESFDDVARESDAGDERVRGSRFQVML